MKKEPKMKLDARTQKRLYTLRAADEALYELWKQSEFGSAEMLAISSLQHKFIHPAIEKILEGQEEVSSHSFSGA